MSIFTFVLIMSFKYIIPAYSLVTTLCCDDSAVFVPLPFTVAKRVRFGSENSMISLIVIKQLL